MYFAYIYCVHAIIISLGVESAELVKTNIARHARHPTPLCAGFSFSLNGFSTPPER
jgi:hypothetical protein